MIDLISSLVPMTIPSKKPLDGVLIKTTLRLLFNMTDKATTGHERQKKQTRHEVMEKKLHGI